jgi:hypothetical protein
VDLSFDEIHDAISAIAGGGVFELRFLGLNKFQVDAGYFDNAADATTAVVAGQNYYKGMYITPNPVIPDLLARSVNRITPRATTQTHDHEVIRRRWLLVDIDAIRPAGICSTETEHQAALSRAYTICSTLGVLYNFPDPMIIDSGNGAQLMYRLNEENSDEVRDEIQAFLHALKALFSDAVCEVDITVYNAARIWRIPGTWNRKGDSTADRPHRRGKVLKYADPFRNLSLIQVLRFNAAHGHLTKLTPKPATKGINRYEYPADERLYQRLNEYAMRSIPAWVQHFFPSARQYKEGYRVASVDIGLDYEEDLTLHPWPLGIKYFGVGDQGDATQGRRTPISVIAEYSLHSDKATAAHALSAHLNFPLTEFAPVVQTAATPSVVGNTASAEMTSLLGASVPKPKYQFATGVRSIADLQRKEFKKIKWVLQDVLPTGNMLLAARPKMRKTWLALQLGIAIASGRMFLDWQAIKGDVLLLALEDNERRIQNRMKILQMFDVVPPDLSGFRYWTGGMDYDQSGRLRLTNPEEAAATLEAFPRGDAGVDALDQYLEEYPNTSTVFIDTLAHFRGPRMSRDVYQSDYDSMTPLTKLAARRNVLIVPIHHEKKGNADRGAGGDFMEDVSGSAGITGGSDGVISIKGRRGRQEDNEARQILISGRDVPYDYAVDVAFDAERGGWLKAARQDIKVAIKALLQQHPFLNHKDIQSLIPNATQNRLYQAIAEMKMAGEVEHTRFGFKLKEV